MYRFALGLGLGRLRLGGIASQVRFCTQLSPPFKCFFVVCQVLQSFSYLNFYSCILCFVSCYGLAWIGQVSSHHTSLTNYPTCIYARPICGHHRDSGLFSQILQRPKPLAVILGISTYSIFPESLRTDFRFHLQKMGCHLLLLNHPCFLSLISLLLSP